jgi:heterodisulfide reductase subunit A
VPKVATIDGEQCLYLQKGRCQTCKKTCQAEAIDFEQEDQIVEERVGAIVVAGGYDVFSKAEYGEYGYGKYPDVIDGLQFERILSASGPFQGKVRRPSDQKEPKDVVFITCVGSRDLLKGAPYCCKVGCMYTAKHTMLYRHRVHDGKAYVFYMDVRAGGKRYEEFVRRAITDEGATYLRGRVSKIQQEDGKLIVSGSDTLSGMQVEIRADMVVLACSVRPQPDIEEVARTFRVTTDEDGFLTESHGKLRPVETNTAGIFLAGACQGPKDIPDTVAQAGCAAAKVLTLFSSDTLTSDPVVVEVDDELCAGCGLCVQACSYEARVLDERTGVATVKEVLCQGCGACAGMCPNGATQLRNFRGRQIVEMVDSLW